MTDVVPQSSPLPMLATPGERLGWIFNDRNLYRRKFMETPPQPAPVPGHLLDRLNRAQRGLTKRILISLGAGVGLAFVIGCCGGIASSQSSGGGAAVGLFAFIALAAGVAGAIFFGVQPTMAKNAIQAAQQETQGQYAAQFADWDNRRQWFEHQQQQSVDAMTEWAAATPSPGTRRVDIIGGTTYGWEAVLTIFGGSLLATRGHMTLVDFTGEALCGELMDLAAMTNRSVQELRLPSELARFDLVAGLEPTELVDCLVEAMYGDAQGANRAERHQDGLLLREICEILAPTITMARLLAALRVLTDRPVQAALTADESGRLLDLQPDESRRQMHAHLRRIEAFLQPLESMGLESSTPDLNDLTCLIADGEGGNAQNELLKDLIVQWLARQVRRESAPMGSLVLLGADEVNHRSIEKLSTLCERRGVRLVLFFGHLREESLHTIGGGEVALMRLGNHQEANQAAEYIGKGHKFVLSQLTRTLGGNETHTLADTIGESETHGGNSGKSYSSHGRTTSYGTNWSKTRNWSQTESTANGTNWSDASSVQRVYEYALEPRVLQDLPEYAMILVKGQGRGSVIQAVEVDPAIITLPRVSMGPLDLPPLPDPTEAVIPATRQPSQVTVSQPQPLAAHEANPQTAAGPSLPGWGQAPVGQPQPQYPQQPYQGPWGGQQ
ncbi:hypothetical protein [Actinoplanes sp. NPDC026619]|uniref:hypothetical protein n=1 Tax=Actinoplanes sp. NPDC026619 TaxID=3155798 RepID=UPI00340BFEDD